jgi:hypothetical protein
MRRLDKFEERLVRMESLPFQELERLLADSRNKCQCPDCPTYNKCAKWDGEAIYCLVGKSKECVVNEVDCVCSDCPLAKELGLRMTHFYCTLGPEKERREQEE